MSPLSRFRIVEIGIGPVSGLATTVLADFGADVVKVVPPEGDPFQAMAFLAFVDARQAHRPRRPAQRR